MEILLACKVCETTEKFEVATKPGDDPAIAWLYAVDALHNSMADTQYPRGIWGACGDSYRLVEGDFSVLKGNCSKNMGGGEHFIVQSTI